MWPSSNERRKYRKVIVERRRRERIDRCLEQLRQLVQPGIQQPHLQPDSSSTTKLEKADILELTVEYLRNLTSHNATSRAVQGYVACLQEVDEFFRQHERQSQLTTNVPSVTSGDGTRLLRAELMTRLSGRAARVVGHVNQRLTTLPETDAFARCSPLQQQPPQHIHHRRRALADINHRSLTTSAVLPRMTASGAVCCSTSNAARSIQMPTRMDWGYHGLVTTTTASGAGCDRDSEVRTSVSLGAYALRTVDDSGSSARARLSCSVKEELATTSMASASDLRRKTHSIKVKVDELSNAENQENEMDFESISSYNDAASINDENYAESTSNFSFDVHGRNIDQDGNMWRPW